MSIAKQMLHGFTWVHARASSMRAAWAMPQTLQFEGKTEIEGVGEKRAHIILRYSTEAGEHFTVRNLVISTLHCVLLGDQIWEKQISCTENVRNEHVILAEILKGRDNLKDLDVKEYGLSEWAECNCLKMEPNVGPL